MLHECGWKSSALAANHAVISDDVARALKAEVGDTLTLSLTVAKDRTAQALTGSVVIDQIIPGTNRAIIGDGTIRIDRLAVAGRTQTAWFRTGPSSGDLGPCSSDQPVGFSVVSRQVLADPPDVSALPAQFAQYEAPKQSCYQPLASTFCWSQASSNVPR